MSAPAMEDPVIMFGAKQALFSTYQGEIHTIMDSRRAHRKAPSPPHAPAVVYSNVVRAAVDMANYWREKLPRVAYSVFPDGAWEIEDLWDAEDIHIYTPKLCREALQFLGQDNNWTLNRFAEDWTRAHPGDLAATVGKKSMADMYDPAEPMAVVDKIFHYGEHNLFPRQFLHRAANLLRTAMLADEERKMSQVAPNNFTSPPIMSKQPDKQQEPVKPPSTSKKNRKQTHIRPKKLIGSTEPAVRPHHLQETTTPYGENVAISRVPSGHVPLIQAPPIHHVAIPLGHVPMVHPVGLQHTGPMHAPIPNLQYVHPAPPTAATRMRGISMGDMTNANVPYYPNSSRPQYVMEPGRINRREKPYGNTLYDPYNGAKPAFNDYGVPARKTSRNGFMDQFGRKTSAQGPRARVGSSGTDWGESGSNSNRFSDHRSLRHNMKDDPTITNDPLRGCHHNWIGPENNNVNELFIGDLPDDVQAEEVEAMFLRVVNIKPTRVTLRTSVSSPRPHAFVMFDNTSQAKLALGANHGNPHIRGTHLRVTVPRRFYQKADDQTTPPQRVVSASLKPAGTTLAKSAPQPLYTSQDARSDLQKEGIPIPTPPAPLPGTTEAVKVADAEHEASKLKSEAAKKIGTAHKPSKLKAEAPEVAATANETSAEQKIEAQKAVDAEPELKIEDDTAVSQSAEQAESPEQPCTPPSENIEEEVATSPVKKHDISKLVASEPHMDAAKSESRTPSPQHTTTGGHIRVESQTKTTYEDTEDIAEGQAVQAAVVKVPEMAKEESTSIKHEESVGKAADNVAVAEPTTPQTAEPALSGLKVDPAISQQPVEVSKAPALAETVKQHGPSQTQSLNPFAKINKSKREKNKKSKKKEQKQEQKHESKTAQVDVVEKTTSAQETDLAQSVEVPKETQAKPTDTYAAEKHVKPQKEQVDPIPEPDDASIGSSATLHPNADMQLTPPSPDAEDDFHTPLQTPSAFSAPKQDESAKRNKKKKNKKKKKTATAAEQTSDSTAPAAPAGGSAANVATQPTSFSQPHIDHVQMHYDVTNSFRSQMSYIDSVRAGVNDPTTYYSQVNVEMEQEKRARERR